jgi:hypothetical protein
VDTAVYNTVLKAVSSPRDLARIPEILSSEWPLIAQLVWTAFFVMSLI